MFESWGSYNRSLQTGGLEQQNAFSQLQRPSPNGSFLALEALVPGCVSVLPLPLVTWLLLSASMCPHDPNATQLCSHNSRPHLARFPARLSLPSPHPQPLLCRGATAIAATEMCSSLGFALRKHAAMAYLQGPVECELS